MRRKSDAKPVLTSPWKIGAFVALLLVFVAMGVVYYLVTFYHVKLSWLTIDALGWSIDSYVFFKEFYPLLAGVVIVSLMSYFLIASAVRRYKFYLDSGQDYRKMISLAGSIDDLTSPTQIARLSSFPELQNVLRSYGDQIREISKDLASKESEFVAAEYESTIAAILKGESVEANGGNAAWIGPLRKLAASLAAERAAVGAAKTGSEQCRSGIARTLLAHGRLMEAASAVGGDCLEIVNDVHELDTVMKNAGSAEAQQQPPKKDDRREAKSAVAELENAARKLEDGGQLLHEFSEETNGVALNLALMAAKGEIAEQELAQFAEKVRGTAERFNRLCETVSTLAQGMLKSCKILKEMGISVPAASGASPAIPNVVRTIAGRLEDRTDQLQKRMCNIGSDLHDIYDILQKALASLDVGSGAKDAGGSGGSTCESLRAPGERVEGLMRGEVFRGARKPSADGERSEGAFVIDHGSAWDGIEGSGAQSEEQRDERAPAEAAPPAAHAASIESAAPPADAAPSADAESSASEASSGDDISFADLAKALGATMDAHRTSREAECEVEERPIKREEAPPTKDERGPCGADQEGSWMEMPGHRWVRIDVEKGEGDAEQTEVEIAVDSAAAGPAPDAPAGRRRPRAAPERAKAPEAEPQAAESPAPNEQEAAGSDGDDPVYDLFDLGAVEYVEEIQIER